MKKFILGLGTVASAVAPIAAVVACGTDSNGLPTLTAEESTTLVKTFATELGITGNLASATDEFQIKFNSVSENGVEFTLERNAKSTFSTGATINFGNLEKSGSALALAVGEVLKLNLVFNTAKDDLATKAFTLSGSKTATKNGVYTPNGSLDKTNLLSLIKKVLKKAIGLNETFVLNSSALGEVKTHMGTVANSAAAVFGDGAGDITAASFTNVSSAKLIAKTNNAKGTFDFTFELTAASGGFVVNLEGEKFLTVSSGKKATVHLTGAIVLSGTGTSTTMTYKVATNEVTVETDSTAQKGKLASTGAETLAKGLYLTATTS